MGGMLRRLEVQNLAVIREAALDFAPGLNVLTGETGAGKSLLVDALALLLGVYTLRPGPAPVETAAVAAATEEEEWTDPLEAEFTELEELLYAISTDDALEITEL